MNNKETAEILEVFKERADAPHLSSRLGVGRYLKMADLIKRFFPSGKILDWGAGCGQMSFLLKNRGLEVVSYEIDAGPRPLLDRAGQRLIVGEDPVKIPFAEASFDAVLSSGVLEHVQNDQASLLEIARILKPGGYFFVFMLPNKFSLIEYFSDRLGRGDHPVKYTMNGIKRILEANGFTVLKQRYQNFLPYNLKGFPVSLQSLYHRLDGLLAKLDHFFTAAPLIGNFSTNLWLVAQKRGNN